MVSRDFEHGSMDRVVFVRCADCGVMVQRSLPTPAELLRAYPPDYHAYHEYTNPLMIWLKARYYVRRAAAYAACVGCPSAHALDVGCGPGDFLLALRRVCPEWRLLGVDFNPTIVETARSRGLDIRAGTLEGAAFPDESFDLIVMNHMIEHAFDPAATLAECRRILRPGGVLVGETPNLDCWDFDVARAYWGGLHAPRHTMLFTPPSLERTARHTGLELLWIKQAVQPAHPALSIQNWLQSHRATRLRLRNGRAFYYPYLLLALLPMAWLQVWTGRSGVMAFAFRRPMA